MKNMDFKSRSQSRLNLVEGEDFFLFISIYNED